MNQRRLIPKLLLKRSQYGHNPRPVLVTTVRFSQAIETGDPVSQARIFEAQAADELIFLNLDPQAVSVEVFCQVLQEASREIFMPFTVGGGVGSLADFRRLLRNGADKISVNSAALNRPQLLREASEAFGAQCVVLSIDYRYDDAGKPRVCADGGRRLTDWEPLAWAREGERLGVGEILLTCIDRDGMRQGLDTGVVSAVCAQVGVPVIASGGCGEASHFVDGLRAGASAVAAGTYFCFKDENPMQTRSQIRNAGFPIRLLT